MKELAEVGLSIHIYEAPFQLMPAPGYARIGTGEQVLSVIPENKQQGRQVQLDQAWHHHTRRSELTIK